jgi:hypothetical protein
MIEEISNEEISSPEFSFGRDRRRIRRQLPKGDKWTKRRISQFGSKPDGAKPSVSEIA